MMKQTPDRTESVPENEVDDLQHPRGTLVIVLLYGLFFALGWWALYVFEFLPRGAPTQ